MAVKFQVSFLVMALCCSMVNSRCPNNRCHSTHLKFGGRIRMSSVGNSEGGTPSLVIMQLPRKSTKLLRTTAGSIYVRQKSDECQAPDSERNFVCPAPLNEERPCADAQLPCNHNYHPPAFNGSDILTLTDVNDTAVTITWRDWDESSDLGYGPVSGYKIEYREKDSRSFIALPKLEKNITSSRVTGLQPGTHYEFRLIIAGDGIFAGYGSPTDVYRVRTDCRVPQKPTLDIQSRSITKGSVNFSIEIPTASDWSCRNASAFIENSDDKSDRHSVDLSTTSIRIETLTSCTSYTYQLKIYAEGKNDTSKVQSFTTSPDDPPPPTLTAGRVNSSAVNIHVHFRNNEKWNCGNWRMRLKQNNENIRTSDVPNEADTSITVGGLEPCKNYTYQLKLIDNDKILSSVSSNVIDVSTEVIAPSSPPVDVRQTQLPKRQLRFVWEMPTSDCKCCGEFISNYSYVLLEDDREVRRNVTVDNYVEFDELIPYTTYSFKVRASSSGGDSDYSSHVEETTLEDSPPKMSIVEPELLNATTLKITWSPPSPPHGIIIGYHLRYRLNEENQTWTDTYIDGQSENVHYIIVNPDSNYAFQIRANTSVGYGEWSDERNETTAERAPGPPAAGNVTEKSEKWVIVRWDKPQITNGVIIKYEISWRTLKSPNGKVLSKNLTVNASIHQVNISSLTPSSLYEIQIAGYTSAGRGEVFIFNVSTKVTTELKPIKTKEVSVKRSTTKKGFEITLPPLTQEYATNYVIVIRISIKKYEVLAELNKSNHDVTFSLTEEKLKEYGFDEDSNPAILIGVKSTCGEETTVIWSDVIEIPVNVSITKNNLFIIIIVSCVVFSILFILIAFTSFMICRHFRDEWRYNKTQFEDDSAYLALERKHSSTSDRYMELNIKDQGEKKLPSVSSVSKIKVESGETEVNYSGFIETGEDVLATTDDLILLGSDVSANKKTSMGTFRKPSSANSHTTVDGSAGNAKSQMTSSELTGEIGQLATENKFANNPAVQRAVERFKAATVPQLYNTEIYDQSSEARLMNSKISKTNGRSAGPIVITKDGKVIRQSYDKVIVTDLSSEMAGYPTDVITGNTAFTGSYIDPDEVNSEKNHWGNTKDVSLKGNRGGNQRASYVEVDETGRISNKRDLRSSYLSLDEEAMSRDKQASVSPSKPSYIELDAEAMKTDKDNLQTTSGTPYLELDEQAMTNDKSDTVAGVKASYIELDEKAMSEDKDKLLSNPRASYFEVGGQTVKTNKGDTTYSSKAAYIEVDEIGMAEGKDETLASSRVSYFEVDDRGIKRKKEGASINSKAYIELDEQAMKTEALSPKQNPGPSYLTIEEEGIKRNRDATISSKSSYIELDDHAMTRDAKLASLRASYMELDKDGITSLRERENSSRYKELKKGRLPSGKVQNNVLARVQEDDAPFNQPHNTASDVKLDEIYHEPKRQYSARRPYEDKILEQHLPNTANPMTRHQNSVKYEACVPIGSSDVGDDMYDENVVDGYSRSRSGFGISHHADRNQRISSYDGSIFRPSNVEERQDNEGIYFHADETDEMSSFHGGYETENTISPEQDESLYDETTVPEVMQGESQSIYEEIPAERAAFQKQKQASILQSFKTKVGWSGAMRSAKRSPLPALPANGKTNSSSSMFEPILEGQADDTYEVLPGEKVMGQKHN